MKKIIKPVINNFWKTINFKLKNLNYTYLPWNYEILQTWNLKFGIYTVLETDLE